MNSNYILIAIVLVGFVLRLYSINNPVADWHSWRQADTAAVTRNFYEFGFNPLIPRYDDLSNIQTGEDNPEGYRFVEFPLYQSVVYVASKVGSFLPFSLEVWHRIISIVASLGSVYLLFALGKQYANKRVGLAAAGLFAVLPYTVYYSRVILPEVFLVFFVLLTHYLFSKGYVRIKKSDVTVAYPFLFASAVSAAAALLIKPVAAFFFLPVLYFWIHHRLFSIKHIISAIVYGLIAFLPLVLWRVWMQQFPEGIPAWEWLFNNSSLHLESGKVFNNVVRVMDFLFGYENGGIRYRPAFFYWLVWKRLTELILGYAGIVFVFIAITAFLKNKVQKSWYFITFGLGALLYLIVFAEGNVRHDYYQVITMPILVYIVGIGIDYVLQWAHTKKAELLGYGAVGIISLVAIWFSWNIVHTYYWINNQAIVAAGSAADRLLPADAKVIAPYGGDTAFLYQVRRQGWPIGFEIEDKIEKGATHYVTVSPQDPEVLGLKQQYSVLEETDSYVIIQLQ